MFTFVAIVLASRPASAQQFDVLISKHALVYGLPHELVRRVIKRESRYNPLAVYNGNYGLMQIRLGTARAMGYSGDAEGLLDPDTNMTYAVKYLAGAYRAADCDSDRAMRLYSTGYYAEAKRLGFSPYTLASTRAENGQSSRSAERAGVSVRDEKTMPITGAISVGHKPSTPSTEIAEIYECVKRY